MKKTYKILLLAAALSFFSCAKTEQAGPEEVILSTEEVTFSLSIAETESKAYSPIGRVTWTPGDVIFIGTDKADVSMNGVSYDNGVPANGAKVVLTAEDISEDGRTATIKASGLPVGATKYYAAAVDKANKFWSMNTYGTVTTGRSWGGGTRDGEYPHVAVAYCDASENMTLNFKNADCILHWSDKSGTIRGLKIKGKNKEKVHVQFTYRATNDATGIGADMPGDATCYKSQMWSTVPDMYCLLAPGLSFPDGLILEAYSNASLGESDKIGYAVTPAITTAAGLFLDLGDISARLTNSAPLATVTAKVGSDDAYTVIDQVNKAVNIYHVSDGNSLTTLSFTCNAGYTTSLAGEWPTKTLKCTKYDNVVPYTVNLVDYVASDDAYRMADKFTAQNWSLKWNDEFKAAALDPNTWKQIPAGTSAWNCQMDATNADLVVCDPENSLVNLIAKKGTNGTTDVDGYPISEGYVTGGIQTRGLHPFKLDEATYTRIDVRAWVDAGKGFWPAIWMVNNENTSDYLLYGGELDICEFQAETRAYQLYPSVSSLTPSVYQTFHTSNNKDNTKVTSSTTGTWHIYSVVVSASGVDYYIDGVKTHSLASSSEQADYPFYGYKYGYDLRLSSQLSSSVLQWQGQSLPDADQLNFKIDFVRYYTAD
ncbi:MAG: family 16 glycosylhydrolase [Candidatus Cryptobacteroides sp.]